MRTKTINIYEFSELSEDAKQIAIAHHREHGVFTDYLIDEASDSLKEFCKIFSINVRQFDFCEMYRSQWRIGIDDNILELKGLRLATYIYNNYYKELTKGKYYGHLKTVRNERFVHPCLKDYVLSGGENKGKHYMSYHSRIRREMDNCPFTGVCYDMDLLDPIIKFLKHPDSNIDFESLLNDCLHSLAKSVESEIEYRYSDKGIIEDLENNDSEYDEDGYLI